MFAEYRKHFLVIRRSGPGVGVGKVQICKSGSSQPTREPSIGVFRFWIPRTVVIGEG